MGYTSDQVKIFPTYGQWGIKVALSNSLVPVVRQVDCTHHTTQQHHYNTNSNHYQKNEQKHWIKLSSF
jgi:hypothetical protein